MFQVDQTNVGEGSQAWWNTSVHPVIQGADAGASKIQGQPQ